MAECGYICKCCGKEFEPTCHKSKQIYCSAACRYKYNNRKRYAPPENKCVECGKELEQKESVGKKRRFCSDECRRKYHRRKMQERKREEREKPRICPYCGKEFVVMWEKGGIPRFCSEECRIGWWKEYRRVTPKDEGRQEKCAYCGKELKDKSRKYCSRVCYRLGAAQLRGEKRCIWCGKLLGKKANPGQKYCSNTCGAAARRESKKERGNKCCILTRNSGAWRKQLSRLAKEMPFAEKRDKRIYIVCGLVRLKDASAEWMANYIRYELKSDPFDGNVYIFCGSNRKQLKWVEWDGSGFCIGKRDSEAGTYPRPVEKAPAIMEITEQEYMFLRSGYSAKRAEKVQKSL